MCLGEITVVREIWKENDVPMARVEDGDEAVCALYVPDVVPGAHVLVHLGFIVEVLTPEQAGDAVALRMRGSRTKEAIRDE